MTATRATGILMCIAFVMTTLTSAVLAGPGDLDLTFGTQGKVTTDFIGTNDRAAAMAVQSDGKIVVVGSSADAAGRSGINVARYNANGSLDTSFAGSGKYRFSTSFIESTSGFAVAIQADGKIVIVGTNTFLDTPASLIVTRLNTDGTLDTGFGTSGFKYVTHSATDWFGSAVAIQGDGKIVAGGIFIASNETWGFSAARLNTDGSLDTTFDNDGKVMVRVGNACTTSPPSFACSVEEVWKLAIQSDNKILLAGNAWNGSNQDFAMVRLNSNGSLDANFGSSGKVKTAIGTGDDKAYGLAILSDNKILLAGSAGTGSMADFALARYNSDGTLDTDFDTDGIVIAAIGAGEDVATSLIVAPDSTIVVAGYSNNGTNLDYVLASYNANGSPDTSLTVSGYVVTPIGTANDMATCHAVQNGKLVVAGYTRNGNNDDFGLARYDFNLGVTPDLVRKMIPYAGGLITAFDSGLIYFSPDTLFPGGGGDTIRLYAGSQSVIEMIPFGTGVITAFSGTAIYYSPDGRRLGGGGNTIRVFNGGKSVSAMIPYQNGVITAFRQGFPFPTGGGIYYSPDGLNLGGGGNTIQVYSGTQMVVKMIPYGNGVITAFSANWIYYSPDGLNLGGGGATTRVYSGTERVVAMTVYQNSVITAFNSGAIYNSPDGQNLGGGGNTQQVYPSGVMTPVALIGHQNGVLTAFRSGTIYAVYYSPDGQDLAAQSGLGSSTEMALFSTSGVRSLIPYQSGAIIAMSNKVIIYSPDGTSFAWLFGGNPIRIY